METTIYTKEHKFMVERLKQARKDAGLSQEQVASMLKHNQSFVSKLESGQRRVDIVELRMFAKLYGKPLTYFVPD